MRPGLSRAARISAVAALTLTLAACGSRLSPDEVVSAGGGSGVSQGGELSGTGLDGNGTDPATGGDAGTGDDVSGGTSGGSTTPGDGAAGGGSGSGGNSASGGTTEGTGQNAAGGASKAAACDGFKNTTGVTKDTIKIANASDISGPVPGLFQGAQDGIRAYVAFFNSQSDICGRKLELLALDSRTDNGGDQQAYTKACQTAFAAVGSQSAFDSGGAATAEECGIPDIRATSVTTERFSCKNCYSAQSVNSSQFQNAVPDFIKKTTPQGAKNAAYLWINAGAGPLNAKNQAKAMTKRGMRFVYQQAIDVAEFNYAPFVQQMKSKNVDYVQFLGAFQQGVRLAKAMQQQNFKPDLFMLDPTAYNSRYVEEGGDAVEGTHVFLNTAAFAEAQTNKEMGLYQAWLNQVKPGADPDYFGVFAWSAARLFVEQSLKLGGKLNRQSLIQSLGSVRNWTANGIHSPQQVGARNVGDCWRFLRLQSGKWNPVGGTRYTCNGVTKLN